MKYEFKGTPPPWHRHNTAQDLEVYQKETGNRWLHTMDYIMTNDMKRICSIDMNITTHGVIGGWGSVDNLTEHLANISLIENAPDLLLVAQDLLDNLIGLMPNIEETENVKHAQRVINKALHPSIRSIFPTILR